MKYTIILFLSSVTLIAQPYKPVAEATNSFGFDLGLGISKKPDYLFSPLSISSALAMTYVGALGETRNQMKNVLHYPEDVLLHQGFADLSNIFLQPVKGTTVSVANKLWVARDGVSLDANFVDINRKYYNAALDTVDIRDPDGTTKTINQWVSDNTNQKITDLIQPHMISSDVILVLTNAVYFKSEWKRKFDPSATIKDKFTTDGNKKIDVLYMVNKGSYRSAQDEIVSILELPYVGDEFSFLVFLPRNSMRELEDYLTLDNFNSWMNALKETNFGTVKLPKFKSSFNVELASLLKDMGMPSAFTPAAEFEGIGHAGGKIQLSMVVHQSFIEVNEAGTEAAAATAVIAVARSAPINFIVDRPFIYAIRHVKTNTLLFIGKATNPQY